jgi:hypothetical protein
MKNKLITGMSAIILLAATFTSCKRNNVLVDELQTTAEISEQQAKTEYIDADTDGITDESAAKMGLWGGNGCNTPNFMNWNGGCAVVTTSGNFPAKTITVDFGTGCTNAKGVTRKGIINILLTDSIQNSGAVATITFNNYFVNGFKRDGTVTRTNTSVAGSGIRSFNRTVTNGQITSPAGLVWTRTCNLNILQTAGMSTPCDLSDDIYNITGTRSTTNAAGKMRTATTQTPLQRKMNCANIDQGILLITGPNHTATIDFGNGTCDNQAVITVNGKAPKTITLK